jgi:hypothetical protein
METSKSEPGWKRTREGESRGNLPGGKSLRSLDLKANASKEDGLARRYQGKGISLEAGRTLLRAR